MKYKMQVSEKCKNQLVHAFFGVLFMTLCAAPAIAQRLERKAIIEIVSKARVAIDSHYVIVPKRKLISAYLDSSLKAGSYFNISDPDSFASKLTIDLRKASTDKHLYIDHIKGDSKSDSFDWDQWAKQERIDEINKNFGFTELSVLEGNIGYIRMIECMNPDRGLKTAAAALQFLENTKALIIDLRGNGGGYGGLQELFISSYFEEEPTHISTFMTNNQLPDKTYTLPFTFGRRRVGTPLYIIIDRKTGSAAEFFAYTLQSFKKAIIIGEPSAGAAHMNSYYPLTKNFRISVSTGAPINPITHSNWEGVGIIPDVVCLPKDAKELALQRILETLNKK
jgi:retinol-binding protein 3